MRSGVRVATVLAVMVPVFFVLGALSSSGTNVGAQRGPAAVMPASAPAVVTAVPAVSTSTHHETNAPVPAVAVSTPAVGGAAVPVGQNQASAGQNQASAGQNQASAGQNQAPADENQVVNGPQEPPTAERTLEKIPILMYHEIADKPNNNYVNRADFAAQMQWLADHGYHGVTLGEVYRHLYQKAAIAPKPVAITFDDGYETFYTTAVPILQQYHFRATNFIITGDVGHPEFMTWEMVTQLPKLGMEVGAHTVHHLDLRGLSTERLRAEVQGSKTALEERLGIPVQFFCYPSGKYNAAVLDEVKAAGYLAGVTTDYGPATPDQDPLILDRVRILRTDTPVSLGEKVKRASAEP